MPSTIEFTTLNCAGGLSYIVPSDPTGEPDPSGNILFKNSLNGNPPATIVVYAAGDKGGTAVDFCGGAPSLTVPGMGMGSSGEATCAVTGDPGFYQYEVSASPSHQTLDPVIIVEPKIINGEDDGPLLFMQSSGGAIGALTITAVVAATIAGFIAYRAGRKSVRGADQ